MAAEIEASANYQRNIKRELDENLDEEAKYSAVDRGQEAQESSNRIVSSFSIISIRKYQLQIISWFSKIVLLYPLPNLPPDFNLYRI